ncbi:MAG TPA: hypothetical protein VGG13_00590 [Candidatus Saccharimonadales bacterium]|jgi:tRNA threonylcarbamoyladenosine biosynthesis protein TsaB
MLILTIRTDKPEAELGLFDNDRKLEYITWQAHRELSIVVHKKIEQLLSAEGQTLSNLEGVVCFIGPGSFTGLRIGLTVGNALAYGLQIPIKAAVGDTWIQTGIAELKNGEADEIALPEYGADAHITQQKK